MKYGCCESVCDAGGSAVAAREKSACSAQCEGKFGSLERRMGEWEGVTVSKSGERVQTPLE